MLTTPRRLFLILGGALWAVQATDGTGQVQKKPTTLLGKRPVIVGHTQLRISSRPLLAAV